VVLEDLALNARLDDDGAAVAVTNVRNVAERLGLNKDTVAGAIRRLVAAGVVVHHAQHTDTAGRFGQAVYHLRLPAGLALGPCPTQRDAAVAIDPERSGDAEPVVVTQMRRHHNPARDNHQLNLLEPNA
jgi:hypothetical protein